MRTAANPAHHLEHLPALLNQWAEAIDRLAVEAGRKEAPQPPAPARRPEAPAFAPPLDQWAEAVDRLRVRAG